ncbi:hypothetical protein R3Q56_004224 [Pseudomonas aeruginosa]|nr:hypothetical protein [Pseudomonas aeruginosa]
MEAVISVSSAIEADKYPLFFVLNVNAEFLQRAESLRQACTNGIIRVVSDSSYGIWFEESEDDDLRLFGDELVVDRLGTIWLKTYSKTLNCEFETTKVDLTTIRTDYEACEELVFYGYNESQMRERYDEVRVSSVR